MSRTAEALRGGALEPVPEDEGLRPHPRPQRRSPRRSGERGRPSPALQRRGRPLPPASALVPSGGRRLDPRYRGAWRRPRRSPTSAAAPGSPRASSRSGDSTSWASTPTRRCWRRPGAPAAPATSRGEAAATGLADGSVDLAIAAQAFHWFDIPSDPRRARTHPPPRPAGRRLSGTCGPSKARSWRSTTPFSGRGAASTPSSRATRRPAAGLKTLCGRPRSQGGGLRQRAAARSRRLLRPGGLELLRHPRGGRSTRLRPGSPGASSTAHQSTGIVALRYDTVADRLAARYSVSRIFRSRTCDGLKPSRRRKWSAASRRASAGTSPTISLPTTETP